VLTILVGDSFPETRETYNEALLRKLPRDVVIWFKEIYRPGKVQIIRVYTDTLINYIGSAIAEQSILPKDVQIRVGNAWVRYNSEGVVSANWPHGIFNWS